MYYIPQNSKTKFSLFHYMKLSRQVFSMKGSNANLLMAAGKHDVK